MAAFFSNYPFRKECPLGQIKGGTRNGKEKAINLNRTFWGHDDDVYSAIYQLFGFPAGVSDALCP